MLCECVCICVYMHHYDRHQSSRGTQGTGAPQRGTCTLLHLITAVIYYYDTLAAKHPKQRECKSFLLSLLLCSCCCSWCCCCWDRQTDRQTDLVMLFPLLLLVVSVAFACDCLCFACVCLWFWLFVACLCRRCCFCFACICLWVCLVFAYVCSLFVLVSIFSVFSWFDPIIHRRCCMVDLSSATTGSTTFWVFIGKNAQFSKLLTHITSNAVE